MLTELNKPPGSGGEAKACQSRQHAAAESNEAATPDERPRRERWTVIEEFEYDGFCYRFSRRRIEPMSPVPRLTKRERQALGYARRGYNNKLIASALGVAPSTVGVLLFRAAAKIGAKSRRELLSAYARLEME